MSTARSVCMEVAIAVFTLLRKRVLGAQVRGLHGVADLGFGQTVDVYENSADDYARDLRGCVSRLARARGFVGSGAVSRRWRPKAPSVMANEMSENPLAMLWLVVEDHAEKAACGARRPHRIEVNLELDAALNAHHRRP